MLKDNLPVMNTEPSMTPTAKPKKGIRVRKTTFFIIIIIAIAGLYGCFHYYNKYKALTTDPNAEAQKMTMELVGVLGKLMELPADETPTVATISDKEKLAGQVFFKNAENGDILFAYTNAMKAILYRPTTNKIINVAPISINQPQNITSGAKQGIQTNQPVQTTQPAQTTQIDKQNSNNQSTTTRR